MSKVKAIPDGYRNVTPYLFVRGAARAIDYYKNAFGAVEKVRMPGPDGKIGHAELQIGDSMIMLADENPQMHAKSPETLGGSTNSLVLYVEHVDSVVDKAVKSGAKLVRPVADQFYGDRMGTIADPFGQVWSVGTHIEDVSPEEMKKRMTKMASQAAGQS
jgi:PhnB protein